MAHRPLATVYRLNGAFTLPTRWFLLLVVAVVLAAGLVAARNPRHADGPPPRATNSGGAGSFMPSGTPASGRFRFVDLTGQPAPDFTLTELDGRRHTLSDYRGKVVMLIFWATWCKTCPIELPHLAYIAHALAPKGLVTLSINWEKSAGPIAKMARDTRLGVPVLRDLDQKTRYDYDAWAVPRVVIVSRVGKIARVIRGYEGEASPIVAALAEQGLPLPGFGGVVKAVPVERVPPAGR
jgi:thiol-disulfide isomerase/thioredoxin